MKLSNTEPLNGPHKELFANGGVSGEGQLKNGKRQGKWKFYHKRGGVKAVGKYTKESLIKF